MPVLLEDLLAEPSLRLRALALPPQAAANVVQWSSTTELPNPVPFLRGGELVMTTAMLARSDSDWLDLAERLAELPVAAVCVGTGLVHDEVPEGLLRAARRTGLPLICSPVEVPFIQISHWLADRIYADHYASVQATVTVQDGLVRELLSRHGVRGLVRELSGQVEAGAVLLTGPDGHVLERHPAGSSWVPGVEPAPGTSAMVTVEDVPVGMLHTEHPPRYAGVLSFAATVLGLELGRAQALLTGRRELLGHALEDVLRRIVSDADSNRRLRSLGVRSDEPHTVVVAIVPGPPEQLRRVPWELGSVLRRGEEVIPIALLETSVVALVPGSMDAREVAETMEAQLGRLAKPVRVGVGSTRDGVSGLRLGYFEARQVATPGIGVAAPLSMTGLLIGNLDLPLAELGAEILWPLLEHDRLHSSELVGTLRAYLHHDCSPSATAKHLVLHRNTLRYRLGLVQRLLGRDLRRLDDQIELALALGALDPAVSDPGA